MTSQWYVLSSKPHKEKVLVHQLQAKGLEIFYPCYFGEEVHSRQLRLKPLFPGYIFVRVDLEVVRLSAFQWMPFTSGLVCYGGKPAYVPDPLIRAIRRHVNDVNFKTGECSEEGLDDEGEYRSKLDNAIFDLCRTGNERARVFLQLLNQMSYSPELNVY